MGNIWRMCNIHCFQCILKNGVNYYYLQILPIHRPVGTESQYDNVNIRSYTYVVRSITNWRLGGSCENDTFSSNKLNICSVLNNLTTITVRIINYNHMSRLHSIVHPLHNFKSSLFKLRFQSSHCINNTILCSRHRAKFPLIPVPYYHI